MRLYFTRHGESEANILHVISNRDLPHGLTARGREQAAALAVNLQGQGIAALYSSPLPRAVQTSEILAGAINMPVQVTDALREYDCGILEGRSDAATWDSYTELLRDWIERGKRESRMEQGESFLDMQARFVPFVEHLTQVYAGSAAAVLLVGHGGLYNCMLPLVLTNIDPQFPFDHPIRNIEVILAETRPAGLVCLDWCGTPVPME